MSAIFDKVIEILVSLGINKTFFYQFAIFCVAYFGMSQIVFKPYLKAYEERKRRTVGGEEEADALETEAQALEDSYNAEAKALNAKVNTVFKEKISQAQSEKSELIEKARENAEKTLNDGRSDLEKSMTETRATMKEHIPSISKKIEEKFVGS